MANQNDELISKQNKQLDDAIYQSDDSKTDKDEGIDPRTNDIDKSISSLEQTIQRTRTMSGSNLTEKNLIDAVTTLRMRGSETDQLSKQITAISGNSNKNETTGRKRGVNSDKVSAVSSLIEKSITDDPTVAESARVSQYDDYDTIDASIPQLAMALDVYTDAIISPDDVSKKSFLISYSENNIDSNKNDEGTKNVKDNLLDIVRRYGLDRNLRPRVRNAMKYGDEFIAVLDMNKEATKMLNEDDEVLDEGVVLNERMFRDEYTEDALYKIFDENLLPVINADKKIKKEDKDKMRDTVVNETISDITDRINRNVVFTEDSSKLLSDLRKNSNDKEVKRRVTDSGFQGSFVKDLDPRDVVKLELDNVVIGYLYIERMNNSNNTQYNSINSPVGGAASTNERPTNYDASGNMGSASNGGNSNGSMLNSLGREYGQIGSDTIVDQGDYSHMNGSMTGARYYDTALRYGIITDLFVKGIGKKIDKSFVKNNKEFQTEIFSLLKKDYILEKGVKITFLQPNEVFHLKLDSNSTYGLSRLSNSLFSAKLYLSQLLSGIMAAISRGKERRAYYIDIAEDNDVEGTVQEMIRNIRSNEFNLNVFDNDKSISTMFKQLGAGNDFYIPTNDGNAAFTIDTVPALDTSSDQDQLEQLLRSAIAGTGVPENFIDAARDTDFARSLTMQNNNFVRKIVSYQREFGIFWTDIIRRIYEIDYNSSSSIISSDNYKDKEYTDISLIEVNFPAPVYMNLQNNNDQISNVSTTLDFLVQNYYPDQDDNDPELETKKRLFRKNVARDLLQTMDWSSFDEAYESAQVDAVGKKINDEIGKTDKSDDEDDSGMSGF